MLMTFDRNCSAFYHQIWKYYITLVGILGVQLNLAFVLVRCWSTFYGIIHFILLSSPLGQAQIDYFHDLVQGRIISIAKALEVLTGIL